MTRAQALAGGYCRQCAALFGGRQLCQILAADKTICRLDLETQARWRKEYGLPAVRTKGADDGC